MNTDPPNAAELLRSHGLRSTPQRRAILGAFQGGSTEHLSADEVHSRTSQVLPDLGRGTVYAALAEFTELGLLSAFGAPEPVRYETNTVQHDHFRCRLCLRLFDLEDAVPGLNRIAGHGHTIERVETRAEGICSDCSAYEKGLTEGTRAIRATGPSDDWRAMRGVAAAEMDGPLGTLLLAATPRGLIRLGFDDHADAESLRELAKSRRGSQAARHHLDVIIVELERYLNHVSTQIECPVDWDALADTESLRAPLEIPYATTRSYSELSVKRDARRLGRLMGANPIPLVVPCHRVTRGAEEPKVFVGGRERRHWLLLHERSQCR
jgi:Fe2+ or Zn2+ uptake regulation protein/O6-methylguanine-DNA--protein-cysteine methyltransferase